MQDDADARSKNILTGAVGIHELNDHVLVLPAQGNALAVRMADGIVLVDSGSGRGMTAKMINHLREWSDLPVKAICYSHGHMGYNDGAADWLRHAAERGNSRPNCAAGARRRSVPTSPRRSTPLRRTCWSAARQAGRRQTS